jgi:hypothetical protein
MSILLSLKGEPSFDLLNLGFEKLGVGRNEENTIFIDEMAISGEHGEFFQFEEVCFYRDLGSTNGSFLGGSKLTPLLPYPLKGGEILKLAHLPYEITIQSTLPGVNFREIRLIVLLGTALQVVVPVNGNGLVIGINDQGEIFRRETLEGDKYDSAKILLFLTEGASLKVIPPIKPTGLEILKFNGAPLDKGKVCNGGDQVIFNEARVIVLGNYIAASGVAETFVHGKPTPKAKGVKKNRSSNFGNANPADSGAFQAEGRRQGIGIGIKGGEDNLFSIRRLEGKLLLMTIFFFLMTCITFLGFVVTE